jgi:hypothetical protein
MVSRVGPIDFPRIELLEDPVKKRRGEAFGQLFFSQSRMEQSGAPWSRVFVGLRNAPATSTPPPRGHPSYLKDCLLLNAQLSPFVPAPTDSYQSVFGQPAINRQRFGLRPLVGIGNKSQIVFRSKFGNLVR